MKRLYKQAYDHLESLGCPVYIHPDDDGNFSIDGEHPESDKWADYWNRDPEWIFGVNPCVNELLREYGLFCEWVNPGRLGVYEL